ncbi:MAG: hypothetical protein V3V14_10745 [Saprospiraceae bacterium]
MIKNILIFVFVSISSMCWAQLSVAVMVDKDTFFIGSPVTLSYRINVPSDVNLTSLDFNSLLEIENLAFPQDSNYFDKKMDATVLDGGDFQINDQNMIVTKDNKPIPLQGIIKMAFYNVGGFRLPVPKLGHLSAAKELPLERKVIMIFPPAGLTQDSLAIMPIKPVMLENATWEDYIWILYTLLGLALLGFLAYFINKKINAKEETTVVEEVIVKLPAHVIAISALDKLKEKKMWESGNVKGYHSELTHIIRQYIEDRYGVQALEMTTSQLSKEMTSIKLNKEVSGQFIEILQISDIVKFAKGEAGPEINEKFMNNAYSVVKMTKQAEDIGTE